MGIVAKIPLPAIAFGASYRYITMLFGFLDPLGTIVYREQGAKPQIPLQEQAMFSQLPK